MFGGCGNSTATLALPAGSYARHKQRTAERQRRISRDSREISADFPLVVSPIRRARCLRSLRLFCRTYLPETFRLQFSQDQIKVLSKIEEAVTNGGQFALAMPRGSGKTAICLAAVIWSILTGKHQFVMLIAATKKHATEMLESIKTTFETNDLLLADFPEVFYPVRCLEGVAQRRLLWHGDLIRQSTTKERLILPSLPPNAAASACISIAGITGRIRGQLLTRPDGHDIRPTLAIVDDPQTRKSARSPAQNANLERILNADVMGLAGPDTPISVVVPCTVIEPDDLADRILDGERNPQWHGMRTKMVYEWPKGEEAGRLWEEYTELLRHSAKRATVFYRKHRPAMDKGSKVAWPQRRYPGTISAIQHCMNLRIALKDAAFDAEYQNEPHRPDQTEEPRLTADQIADKINRLPRGTVDAMSSVLSAFIDVQENVLFYVVCGFGNYFSGSVIDYGSWPDERRGYWTKADAERPYAAELPNVGFEAQLYNALDKLTAQILGREWSRDGGKGSLAIGRCLIDYGWGVSTDTVFEFCRHSPFRNILLPSKGLGKKASDVPMHDWQKRDGETSGENWRINIPQRRTIRHVLFDTNHWKSFVEERLKTPMGGRGGLTLYGDSPGAHRMFADHATSEDRIRTTNERTGRTVQEWKPPLPGHDNDLWDCLVGCAVGASIQGVKVLDTAGPAPVRKKWNVVF